jgi:hypothetical protein
VVGISKKAQATAESFCNRKQTYGGLNLPEPRKLPRGSGLGGCLGPMVPAPTVGEIRQEALTRKP